MGFFKHLYYLECKWKQLKQCKTFTIGLWCKTLICKCSKLAVTAGNNDGRASPYQELQNVRWTKVMVEMQMCSWLTSLYCDIWCSNVYFPSFLHVFTQTSCHFPTMLPSIWEEFAIKANILFSCIATKLLWKFERWYKKRAANVRALTSQTHNQIFSHRRDDAPGLHLWSSLLPFLAAAWVYLVPREIDHIPARSVCPRLLSEEHARTFLWFCHKLPNANHNFLDCSAC